MSIKLMKQQRWLMEEMDDKKDSTEIVDMDVDEREEYEIISEMEKPTNFLTHGSLENEEPKAIGMNVQPQVAAASLKVKRKKRSRWDVGAPFDIHLNDTLAPTTNGIEPNSFTLDFRETRDGAISETFEIGKVSIQTNEDVAEKVASMKIEENLVNSEQSITADSKNARNSNNNEILLEEIALPCNPCDIALPPEPTQSNGNVTEMQLPGIPEVEQHESEVSPTDTSPEAASNKSKVVMKWKCTKTQKEFPTVSVKLWELETEVRELPKVHFEEHSKDQKISLKSAESLLHVKNDLSGSDSGEVDKIHFQATSPTQQPLQHTEVALPHLSSRQNGSLQPGNDAASPSEHGESSADAKHEIQSVVSELLLQEVPNEEPSEGQSKNGSQESYPVVASQDIPEFMLYDSEIQSYGLETDKKTLKVEECEPAPELRCQAADASWLTTFPVPKSDLQEAEPLPPRSGSRSQQWRFNVIRCEPNLEVEQESSSSSASLTTSPVSTYSFSSTPKTFPSPDVSILRSTVEERKQFCAINLPSDPVGIANGIPSPLEASSASIEEATKLDETTATEPEPVKPSSQPTPYEHLDDNIILCDENLIKEARVVRCFCEPTPEEVAEGRGCSSGCINRELYTECGSRCASGTGCANRRFHNKQYAQVEAFDAGVKGWGLRAVEPLEPGRFIIEYVGEVIDAEEMLRRGRRYGKDPKHVHHYLMALKNGAVIDATVKGNVSRFINHSCDPNCESQKWTVDRQLKVGFFAIKPIAVGEEIVFDYQLERYGRKAQRCFCGAANCRGRIADDSESDEEEDKINDEAETEESEEDEEIPLTELKAKSQKKERDSRTAKKRKKQSSVQRYNKAIRNTLSRGPPRNRTQVRDLVRLMVQVEQAPQRSSLIQCIRFAHPDVLRLFIQECGLRLLYVFLATDYPIDDEQSVLQLQIKSLDLLDVMPIVNKNQVNDSHLATTVEKIASKRGPVDEVVEDVMRRLVDAVCCEMPSTSQYSALTPPEDSDPTIERLHCEMVIKAAKLMVKWKNLREEFRIPRRGRTDSGPAQHDISRYVRRAEEDGRSKRIIVDKKDDGSTLWRLSGFGPPPKRRYFDRRRFPKTDMPIFVKDLTHLDNEDFKQSPVSVADLTHIICEDDGACKPKKRRSRFDIVGERNPSSMYELYATDTDPYAPPPPTLLPEAMFAAGLPDSINFSYGDQPFPEFFDWNAVYAKYDPSSAAYQQFIDYYQQQQYAVMGMPPCPQTPQKTAEMANILEAPSPPPPKRPKTPLENLNMLTIGPIDMENPRDEDIEMLEKHLAALKSKRAEIKKREQEEQKKPDPESNETNGIPPPPPPAQSKQSLWVQATTEEGAVYYYNKETRETAWTLPEESENGNASADTTTDRIDTRATFKAEIVKYVGGMLEPIRKLKFASAEDYKYVLRKLTHTILEKELKRVGEMELKVTESVRDKARKFVAEYLARLGDGQYSRKNKVHNSY